MSRAIEPLANDIKRELYEHADIVFEISVNGPERKCFLHADHIPVEALGEDYTIFTSVNLSITLSNDSFEVKLIPLSDCSFDHYSFMEHEFHKSELKIDNGAYIKLPSTVTDREMIDTLKRFVDIYVWLYTIKQIDDRKNEFQKARELLAATKCAQIDLELKEKLTDLIIRDIHRRLVDAKAALLTDEAVPSILAFQEMYYSDKEILIPEDDEAKDRMFQLIHRGYILGDHTVEDHLFLIPRRGIVICYSAALLLYILFYSKKGFNLLTYEDCVGLNKFERILLKIVEKDALDTDISVSAFETKIAHIIPKLRGII